MTSTLGTISCHNLTMFAVRTLHNVTGGPLVTRNFV